MSIAKASSARHAPTIVVCGPNEQYRCFSVKDFKELLLLLDSGFRSVSTPSTPVIEPVAKEAPITERIPTPNTAMKSIRTQTTHSPDPQRPSDPERPSDPQRPSDHQRLPNTNPTKTRRALLKSFDAAGSTDIDDIRLLVQEAEQELAELRYHCDCYGQTPDTENVLDDHAVHAKRVLRTFLIDLTTTVYGSQ